jgi:hypothetical protein
VALDNGLVQYYCSHPASRGLVKTEDRAATFELRVTVISFFHVVCTWSPHACLDRLELTSLLWLQETREQLNIPPQFIRGQSHLAWQYPEVHI